ncbi:uncharacterized protein A4U43_C03F21950 [Asparagus officinalis]|uniref:Formiminotransferase N-terminal subdomain domain-containing protein n=2 Tax=Asparagus officinalis TaxID=4686 RepID=A0A5P1FGC0_ASPOF|nr:formimidoyltransferase-cyclodeaminase-like isoform X2 [Asparagus officinalis]ONK75919.1 uncharacterized protein A4U43_C03F21950 [Asparagus officinalis]
MAMKNYSKLICCKIYISESRNTMALESIERAARLDRDAVIVNKFEDRAYNRVRYTLVSYIVHHNATDMLYSPIRQTVQTMAEAAFAAVDLETHLGAHPRFGVVDHICFHPLAEATVEEAAAMAKLVASDMGNELQVPVFLYEAAHPDNKALDAIRRELGYYRPNFMGSQWAGWALPDILPIAPDEGSVNVNRARGIAVIGASPWIDTFNIPFLSTDIATVKRIARSVSARGGGLPSVQALALVHGDDSIEIACMLLDSKQVGADQVQARVELIAAQEGLEVEKGYFTDFSQDMIVERYIRLVSID